MPFPACAGGAANAMHVGLGVVGDVVINHVRDPLYIQSTCNNVGRHKDIELAVAQTPDRPFALHLRNIAIQRLSGKTHRVLTGYCICCKDKNRIFSETVKTDVRFKKLTDSEIKWYIQTGEPFDKAGGYAIQGIGSFLVRSIKGSYTNVVGLPVCEVMEFLSKEGVIGLNPTKR